MPISEFRMIFSLYRKTAKSKKLNNNNDNNNKIMKIYIYCNHPLSILRSSFVLTQTRSLDENYSFYAAIIPEGRRNHCYFFLSL